MNSGGRVGGGIPWEGVRLFLQRGAAAGLSDDQLMALLNNPSFMHAANDPDGGTRSNRRGEANGPDVAWPVGRVLTAALRKR